MFVHTNNLFIFVLLFNKRTIKFKEMQEKDNKTQAERLADELMELKPNVTSGDRTELHKAHGFSKGLISLYLNGNVFNEDTAATMIKFLRKRIADREKVLTK